MVAIISIAGSTAALAAYNVGAQLATLAFVPAGGLAGAATTVVGQNLGADRPGRASRATWLSTGFVVVALLGLGVLQWLFPTLIAETFAPPSAREAFGLTVDYLQILAVGYWALGAIYTLESGFNGASRTSVSMYATLVQYWAVRLPHRGGRRVRLQLRRARGVLGRHDIERRGGPRPRSLLLVLDGPRSAGAGSVDGRGGLTSSLSPFERSVVLQSSDSAARGSLRSPLARNVASLRSATRRTRNAYPSGPLPTP